MRPTCRAACVRAWHTRQHTRHGARMPICAECSRTMYVHGGEPHSEAVPLSRTVLGKGEGAEYGPPAEAMGVGCEAVVG